ncbi:MAG: hypothetical protein MJZ25_15685 [Fibrobacter sp.]|nr:hypothetical protein [Fibrobacter sp.]
MTRNRALGILAFAIACVVLTPAVSSASVDKLDRYDSAHVNTLNMTDEEIAAALGVDSAKLAQGPSLQELNEENPSYIKREYNHKQQVVVGSVVMFCVALAMVLMNNYNPSR